MATIGFILFVGIGSMTLLGNTSILKMKPSLIFSSPDSKKIKKPQAFYMESKLPVDIEKRFALQGGKDLFMSNCAVCHGEKLEGLEYLGVKLVNNPFVINRSREELMEHIKKGRPLVDPKNRTGVIMPGFPQFSKNELNRLAIFLKPE